MKLTSVKNALAMILCVGILSACATESELNRRAGIKVEQEGQDVRLVLPNSVLFNTNEANILSSSDEALKRSAVLVKRSTQPVWVEGHTDNVGSLEYNQTLSEQRAQVVADRLVQSGIVSDRVKSKGFSFTKPTTTNDTADGRQANRRTDIVILNETVDSIMNKK